MQPWECEHAAVAPLFHRAGEAIEPNAELAARDRPHGRVLVHGVAGRQEKRECNDRDASRAGIDVLSEDGALTTTLVSILAERELPVTPVEATAFALGIHEDTGSLTYPTTTQRDAEALAWCLRHGAHQELVTNFLHVPLSTLNQKIKRLNIEVRRKS